MRFYFRMAVLIGAMAFVGFAPTFYLRSAFGAPPTVSGSTTLTPLVQLHGSLFTAWVLLFIAQTWLVSSRRIAVHRRLGWAGVALAVSMIVVGLSTAIGAARRGSGPPGIEPLVFLVVPVFDIVLFTGFVTAAVLLRRNKEAHKRLMLLASIAIIPAAVARWPGLLPLGPLAFFGIAFSLALVAAAYDYRSRSRVSPVYWWGIAVLFLSVPVRLGLSSTDAWLAFATMITR